MVHQLVRFTGSCTSNLNGWTLGIDLWPQSCFFSTQARKIEPEPIEPINPVSKSMLYLVFQGNVNVRSLWKEKYRFNSVQLECVMYFVFELNMHLLLHV